MLPANQDAATTDTHLHLPLHVSTGLVVIETQLIQEQISVTRRAGQSASMSCGGIDGCVSGLYVYWYQKKEAGTFEKLLYISLSGGTPTRYSHPQKDDFSAHVQGNKCELTISSVQVSHAATYYCSCWWRDGTSTVREDVSCLNKNQLLSDEVSVWIRRVNPNPNLNPPAEHLLPGTIR